jgi:hypothetical protein
LQQVELDPELHHRLVQHLLDHQSIQQHRPEQRLLLGLNHIQHLETIRIRREGYEHRRGFTHLLYRYRMLLS